MSAEDHQDKKVKTDDDSKDVKVKTKRDISEFEIRRPRVEDIHDISLVAFEAFNTFNKQVGIPPEFNNLEELEGEFGLMSGIIKDINRDPPRSTGFCAVDKKTNQIVGATLCKYDDEVFSCAWFFVYTHYQGSGIASKMIKLLLQEAQEKKFKSIQLCQLAASAQSFALYAYLGFEAKFNVGAIQGFIRDNVVAEIEAEAKKEGIIIRKMEEKDYDECNKLHIDALQLTRITDIGRDYGHPKYVAVQEGKIVGYTTGLHFEAHNLATSSLVIRALYAEAQKHYVGKSHTPNWNVPFVQYPAEFRWCLHSGLRLIRQLTIMAHHTAFFAYAKEGYIYYPSVAH